MQAVKLCPSQSALVPVGFDSGLTGENQVLFVERDQLLKEVGLILADTVANALSHKWSLLTSRASRTVSKGTVVGEAQTPEVMTPGLDPPMPC